MGKANFVQAVGVCLPLFATAACNTTSQPDAFASGYAACFASAAGVTVNPSTARRWNKEVVAAYGTMDGDTVRVLLSEDGTARDFNVIITPSGKSYGIYQAINQDPALGEVLTVSEQRPQSKELLVAQRLGGQGGEEYYKLNASIQAAPEMPSKLLRMFQSAQRCADVFPAPRG